MPPATRTARVSVPKAEKEADVVMGTNNSSIVSKRSVEMIYYREPHFFRPFVKKPQRRSPIINRGYWLRMYAMAETVRQFMRKTPSDQPKFVLNLGCGFDPLPFMLLSDEKKAGRRGRTVFVDVDYEKLMLNKKISVRQTQNITDLLEKVEFGADHEAVQIRSPRYLAVGCDLKNLQKLDDVMRTSILPSTDCAVLCLAEVSLTYMDVKSANAVIRWASKLTNDMQFCILEQFFPDGPGHPFAKTMMTHFHKLQAPLHAIHEYPSLAQQEQRFRDTGWTQARARSLWALWADNEFLPDSTRRGLDAFEAFDEWEEFALFASHYFLLMASNRPEDSKNTVTDTQQTNEIGRIHDSCGFVLRLHCPRESRGRRRNGALVPDGQDSLGHYGGLGQQARLASTDLYTRSDKLTESCTSFPPRDIPARMCHTITTVNKKTNDCLLAGGRAAPTTPLSDCWLRQDNIWCPTHPLPQPRYRHSAAKVALGESSDLVLVYGGKSDGNSILDSWLLWSNSDEHGWQAVEEDGLKPAARFGACFATITDNFGVFFGGIGRNGTVLVDFWTWDLSRSSDGTPRVALKNLTEAVRTASPNLFPYLFRYGATVSLTSWGLIVAGGIVPLQTVPADKEILLLNWKALVTDAKTANSSTSALITPIGLGDGFAEPRPLFSGHVACTLDSDQVLLLGGGAVCFSFGTFWTEGTWLLCRHDSNPNHNTWALVVPPGSSVSPPRKPLSQSKVQPSALKPRSADLSSSEVGHMPRLNIKSAAHFQQIVANGKPVVIEGSDIGPCTELWTKKYLARAVGEDRQVVVHAAQSETMNFQAKNFAYVTKSFGTFLDEVYAGGRQYLRSISAEQPSKLPADLATDFPGLQNDFGLPEHLALVTDNAHSSPLRISGPVTMWLHYDVMANVLCQVRGSRRLILFPPDDVQSLSIPAGASSSTVDILQHAGADSIAAIPGTSPQEAVLQPGDILFIPPLWLHTACSPTGAVSVAVNVFFRNLSRGYAAGSDVYGNRDLQAYEKSRQDLQKMARAFKGVPPNMTRFYLRRLAQELQEMADQ